MPKIRTSIISEHLRRRVKVPISLPADPSFVRIHSIPTFMERLYLQSPTPTLPADASLQKHRCTPYSRQPLLKPNVDRFNTRGRTIYNAFDCLSLQQQGYPLSHRKNSCGKQKALPKFPRVAPDAHSVTIKGLFKMTKHADDADILRQADRLFETYIRMD